MDKILDNTKSIMDNKLTRLIMALLFFLFIYNIIYNIFIFFSVEENILQMYMIWIAFVIILFSILPMERYSIKIDSINNDS